MTAAARWQKRTFLRALSKEPIPAGLKLPLCIICCIERTNHYAVFSSAMGCPKPVKLERIFSFSDQCHPRPVRVFVQLRGLHHLDRNICAPLRQARFPALPRRPFGRL